MAGSEEVRPRSSASVDVLEAPARGNGHPPSVNGSAGAARSVANEAIALLRRHRRPLSTVAVAVVVVAGALLRSYSPSPLWLDEALTANIAALPVGELFEALRHEGHPPLFYVLLRGWMRVFGDSDTALRALPTACSVAALPLAGLAGGRLAGRAGATAALVLLASSPLAIRYGSEARMYALLLLLVLAAWLAVQYAVDRPTTPRLLAIAALTGLVLLTHYWALYLVGVTVVVLAWLGFVHEGHGRYGRATARRVLLAVAVGVLAFVPWAVWAFERQSQVETTFPPARPASLVAGVVVGVTSGEAALFGAGLVLLAAMAVFARPIGPRALVLEIHTHSPVRAELVVVLATLLMGSLAGVAVGIGGEARYTTVVLPLFLLVAAYGATRLPSWWVRGIVLGAMALLGLLGGAANAVDLRTQAGDVAEALVERAGPGDLVVYCSDQLGPSVSRLLPPGLAGRTFPDSELGPSRIEWADYVGRVREADPRAFAESAVAQVGAGTLWLVWNGGHPTYGAACIEVLRRLEQLRPGGESIVTSFGEAQDTWFEKVSLTGFRSTVAPPTSG